MQSKFINSILAVVLLILSGCSAHRIDIQQGNKVTPENFAKLKIGLSQTQVVFILGSPLLKDPFHEGRWDYLFYLKPGNKATVQSRLTLYFDGDVLTRIDDSAYTPEVHAPKAKPKAANTAGAAHHRHRHSHEKNEKTAE